MMALFLKMDSTKTWSNQFKWRPNWFSWIRSYWKFDTREFNSIPFFAIYMKNCWRTYGSEEYASK
jgi:hypothetical protein